MGYWIYPIIFFVKIIEVTISTIRIILVTKGEKLLGSLLSIVEVSIWLLLVSSVLTNIQSDPLRMVVYVLGCAIGIYYGSVLEGILALGHSTIHIIVDNEEGKALSEIVRGEGFGVTTLPAQGKDEFKRVLLLHVSRKRLKDATRIIRETCPDAIITVNESKTLMNGYGLKK